MSSFKDQGNAAFKGKDFEGAIGLYTKALSETPEDHTILGNRSAANYQLKQYDAALEDAEQCIVRQPDWSKGYQRKAMALQASGKLNEAVEQYEIGCQKDPNNAQCKQFMEAAEMQLAQQMMGSMGGGMGGMPGMGGMGGMGGGMGGMPGMGGADGPFSKANLERIKTMPKFAPYFADIQFKNTFDMCMMNPQMLMQVMQQDPRFMEVFKELTGIDLQAMGEARAKDDEESKEKAEIREAEEKKKAAEAEAKRQAEAEAAMPKEDQVVLQKKRDADAKKLEGNAAYKAKDFPKAISAYSEAIELNPKEATFYTNLAAVYFEMGEYDSVIEQCDKVIQMSKEGGYDYQKLGKAMARKANALFKKDMLTESLQQYREALLEFNDYNIKDAMKKVTKEKERRDALAYINPEIAEQHKEKGNALFKEGNFPDALKEFDEGIKRDPTNKFIYSNRAFAFIKLMDPVRGLADAEKALSLDPEFVKAWARKATCHQLQKEFHKAMDCFEKGLKIDADNKECKDGLAKTMGLIQSNAHASGGQDQERMAHAMADPDIQNIMRDPSVMQVLRDMQENPAAGQAAMRDPEINAKIQKLIAAGVLKVA